MKKAGFNFLSENWLDKLILYLQFDLCVEMRYAKKLRGIKKF